MWIICTCKRLIKDESQKGVQISEKLWEEYTESKRGG